MSLPEGSQRESCSVGQYCMACDRKNQKTYACMDMIGNLKEMCLHHHTCAFLSGKQLL